MARIVAAIGTSHSPVLVIKPQLWPDRVKREMKSEDLYDRTGRRMSYVELERQVERRYAPVATVENFVSLDNAAQRALDRLADDMAEIDPDLVVIIGDDQDELFGMDNLPALAICYGSTITTEWSSFPPGDEQWVLDVKRGYGVDGHHEFAGAPAAARALIEHLVGQGIDIAASSGVPPTSKHGGFGHAITFPIIRLMRKRQIPVVPVLLNTYYPPNQPTPARCFDIGRAMRAALEAWSEPARVVVMASGGLSHFVTDEWLDRTLFDALRDGDEYTLRTIPGKLLNSGNSEIRNWIMMAGAISGLDFTMRWHEYVPIYRSPAGTGIGLGFGRWN
jgi:hypothetical protein